MGERQGLLVVISGPSGVGKSTIAHAVEQRLNAAFSVSMTTRTKTHADREGVDYHFVDEQHFRQAIDNGALLEWANVFGHYYGTPKQPVADAIEGGRIIILEIDVQGGVQVRQRWSQAMMIFILPPSEQELLHRLRSRERDDEETIQRRFREAQHEIQKAKESGAYDAFVVNDDLQKAIEETVELVTQAQSRVNG